MSSFQELDAKNYKAFHLFCGIGGGALGFQQAKAQYKGLPGQFRTLGGIDVDPQVCKDFRMITGVDATCLDLFTAKQYEAFHGKKPPEGWRAATPEDVRKAAGGECPDVVFQSSPCKGYSGLLPAKSANTPKYQALNELALHGIELTLEAFKDDLPSCILFENVPRIASRGAHLLQRIKKLLVDNGFVVDQATHDCGELGGLAQHRLRYLLIARNTKKLGTFIYKPPKLRVKAIGEVLSELPMPDEPSAGMMHRLPRLQWKTLMRLALIPAGGDWRNLEKIAHENYRLEYIPQSGGPYGVQKWDEPGATVIGNARISGSNAVSVADVRLPKRDNRHGNVYKVVKYDEPAPCVVGSKFGSGAAAVADVRLDLENPKFSHAYKVTPWEQPAGSIAGGSGPSAGACCVADKRDRHHSHFKVTKWADPSGTITGATHVANGATCVADERVEGKFERRSKNLGPYCVGRWDCPINTITGRLEVTGKSGIAAISDPRIPCVGRPGAFGVGSWEEPSGTISGSMAVTRSNCRAAIADPRLNEKNGYNGSPGLYGVKEWEEPMSAVTGGAKVSSSNCPAAVADPRYFDNSYKVQEWGKPAGTVTGGNSPSCGAKCVADPRLGCTPRSGSMKVQQWEKPGIAVTGAGDVHAGGSAAVADPRIPEDHERLDPPPVIISLDGSWHRPLTTLELASLQGLPVTLPNGNPLVLSGKSDSKWRERIGNLVPPLAAKAIAQQVLMALLPNEMGEWVLGSTEIWVSSRKSGVNIFPHGKGDATKASKEERYGTA